MRQTLFMPDMELHMLRMQKLFILIIIPAASSFTGTLIWEFPMAQYPEIFDGVPSEGEGLRLVKKTFSYLVKHGKWYLIPGFIIQSGCKYAGYFMGKRYKKLSKKMILRCTMNQTYWNESK